MLKRKAIASIKNWVNTKNKKCLVVQGARQTGKTYIIERFAEDNYEELLEINFKQMVSAVDIFSGDLTVDNMVMAMRFRFPEKKILPGKTLIFLDEIQECQEAITSLKFWAIDNRYDVIVSGSLLGIDYKRASSYPVGYVDYLRMYGIDFEEFLWGMGISEDMIGNLCGYLESKTVIPEAIHSQMMNYYRQYIAIGGMPEAVQKYVDTKDFREVDKIQRSLLLGYQYDIAHYATAEEKVKAEKCYLSLAKQLLDKENHKFQYKEVEHGGRAPKTFFLKLMIGVITGLVAHKLGKITYSTDKKHVFKWTVLAACAGMLFNFIFDPIISYFYDMLILGKPMAQLKIAWSVTTTGVNAVISVIAATIVYMALRPVLIKANLFFKIGKEK